MQMGYLGRCKKKTVLRIRDPFHFGQPDPGSKNSAKSWKISTKINQNKNYHTFFSNIINLCSTDINIYPINNKTDHFLEKFNIKNVFKKFVFSRIHIKMRRIRNTKKEILSLIDIIYYSCITLYVYFNGFKIVQFFSALF